MVGCVRSIAVGREKGKPKKERRAANLFEGHGLIEDVHAGPGHRHIGLISADDFDRARAKFPELKPGSFAENMIIDGLDFSRFRIGSRLRIGDVLLEIAERGKAEWKKGDYSYRGLALMARKGLFARVLAGGRIRKGDGIILVEERPDKT